MAGSRLVLIVSSQVISLLRFFLFLSFFWVPGCAAPTVPLAISCIFMPETSNVRRVRISRTIRCLPSYRVYCLVSFGFSPSFFLVTGYSAPTIFSRHVLHFHARDLQRSSSSDLPHLTTLAPASTSGAALFSFVFPGIVLFISRLMRKSSGHLVFAIAIPVSYRPVSTIPSSPLLQVA